MLIDIRSDTVTKPTAAMRKAMADAEVGDDVYGDDPTVKKLEELGAQMLGLEAALFVPSGTFGNQLALFTWCERGTEVILGDECHIIVHEAGGPSVIAGVQTRCVPDSDGVLMPDDIRKRLRKQALHAPATSLICLESAHSLGMVPSLQNMEAVRDLADEWDLPIHLDGARIFNAAAALGCNASEIAQTADSVMFCLSKGLCAPVGSLLAGTDEFIAEAKLRRKILGGGMRQAGILAAAGLIALKEHVQLLADDHRRARELARGLGDIKGVSVNTGAIDINLVFFTVPAVASPESSKMMVEQFAERGIMINPPNQGLFRFATHYWTGDKEIETILAAARDIFGGANSGRG